MFKSCYEISSKITPYFLWRKASFAKQTRVFLFILCVWAAAFNTKAADGPRVLATTSFIADIAQNIVGENGTAESLLPVGTDPHRYEPTPGDVKKMLEVDLILENGLTLEGWLDKVIQNSGTNAPVVTVTQGINAIHDPEHENSTDPHAWMDPLNGVIYAQNIRDALARANPAAREAYYRNCTAYVERLMALHAEIQKKMRIIPIEKRYLVTSHDAFHYFANRYGLKVISLLGTSTDADVQFGTLKAIDKIVAQYHVPAVFVESTVNPQMMERLAADRGIVVGGKLFSDSLDDPGRPAGTYIGMLRTNADVIFGGLAAHKAGISHEGKENWFLAIAGVVFAATFWVVYKKIHPATEKLVWQNYMITVKGLSVSYDRKTALTNVYLEIEPGYVYGLVGANGSGKSTLLKSILGLIKPDSGVVTINGRGVEEVRSSIAYVPQKEEIDWQFPASVYDVVLMGRYPHKRVFQRLTEEDHAFARKALEQLDIVHLRDKQIGELSGGQQQRTFIARALCQNAEMYFFDEPFVGIDVTTENKIMQIIRLLAAQKKLIVIIHHDLSKVHDYFDRLILLNQRIIAFGPTHEVFTEANMRNTFGGQLTLLQQADKYL